MSVMGELCGGGKPARFCLVILSAFFARRTYAVGGTYCLILGFATEYSTSVRKFTAT